MDMRVYKCVYVYTYGLRETGRIRSTDAIMHAYLMNSAKFLLMNLDMVNLCRFSLMLRPISRTSEANRARNCTVINGCAPGDQGGGEHAGYTSCHAELYLLREEAVAIGRQHVLERVSLVRRRGVDCIHCVHLGLRWLGAPMDVQQRRLDDQIE